MVGIVGVGKRVVGVGKRVVGVGNRVVGECRGTEHGNTSGVNSIEQKRQLAINNQQKEEELQST
jgi:hypothetical protein